MEGFFIFQKRMKKLIYLVGYMGAGKSTLGKQIAEILLMNFVDMDAYIECMQRTSIQNLFDNEGEEQFRKIEQYYLMRLSKLNHTVISCGG